ncbi:DNA polymerase [Tichowtungia aerotolerans]|uniref:DNA-directed DNA polymerase n=1 Tax=Tichowtungia aerotolerans TaxID=2697043 RepID=A0A6P1ME33_9BACT|nr:DNA polymerase [Tichowtungia aerotolerans]QHI69856.1 hypothetical protein GT409_10465 [Tichowtungia aerotolerans]
MPTFAIDFETYYDRAYSLKKMDAWSYVHHPKFDCYLMSVYGTVPQASSLPCPDFQSSNIQQSTSHTLFRWVGHPKDFQCWEKLEGALLLAHNAAFDSLVFRRLQELGVIPDWVGQAVPSEPSPHQSTNPIFHQSSRDLRWRCTASMAVYLQAPRSLKGACKQLLGIEVDKTQRSKACGQTTGDLFEADAMTDYALEDARLCFLLWEKHHHLWPEDEQELATLTFEWGQTGIHVDFQTLEKCIQTLEQQRFDAVQLLPWVDDFTEDTPLSHRQLALECRKAGIPAPASLAMDSPLCEAWENKYGEEYPWVNAMRIFRRTNMLLSRFYAIRNRLVVSGGATPPGEPSSVAAGVDRGISPKAQSLKPMVFPYSLKYFGAVPGRWSGDSGFNVQNMPRGELFGANLRKCFQPSDGNIFIIADLCQIEPRILAWLIDDAAFLDLVQSGVDIYEAHARSTMGYTDPEPLKEKDPAMRSLAKARVLGLGYGCGPKKFMTVAKNLGGIELSFAEAKQTVADFRSKNTRISRLWKWLDRDFKHSAGGDYSIELPSGRCLNYFDVQKTSRGYFTARTVRGGRERSLYGGLLCENLVQATARDLFAQHLLEIHRSGIGRIVFHVHDEVIVEVPKERAGETKEQILEIMRTTPDWLSGCPVDAEAGIFNHYTK